MSAAAPIRTCTIDDARAWPDVHWLDVRSDREWAAGHIAGAQHVPIELLPVQRAHLPTDMNARLVCYCHAGHRSARAAEYLQSVGYTNVWSLREGFPAWQAAGWPSERTAACGAAIEDDRYTRHLALPEVGARGQARLRAAHVVLVGAGGLGCPAATYLTAAGVGTLTIVDDDVVALSNLQRQTLYTTAQFGEPKVICAQQALHAQNPDVHIVPQQRRVTAANVDQLLAGADVVIDGSDNFPTRYLLNDACVRTGTPLIHGSVQRFSGQVSVFCAANGPCYRCLYPEAPPADIAPNCADAGVLGVLPGLVGTLQATEALKIILQIGDPLIGRLLCVDALGMEMRTLALAIDPVCARHKK